MSQRIQDSRHDPLVSMTAAMLFAGVDPTPAGIAAPEPSFLSRSRTPRLAPLGDPAAAGATVTGRLPLTGCPPGAEIDQRVPSGIEPITARHRSVGEPPPTPGHVERARSSGMPVHARTLDAEPVAVERRAVTLFLTRAAHAAGAAIVVLTPGGAPRERVHRRTDPVLFLTKESQ